MPGEMATVNSRFGLSAEVVTQRWYDDSSFGSLRCMRRDGGRLRRRSRRVAIHLDDTAG
jgi:hypothetical protein